jgi:hypothetical protein
MDEKPESIVGLIPENEEIPHDKVDTLSVTHGWKVVGYFFEGFFE